MPSRLNQACVGGAVVGLGLMVLATAAAGDGLPSKGPGPAAWQGDLAPIAAADWSYDRAAHLLERAGFGGTPEEIAALAAMTPQEAVAHLVDYEAIANDHLPAFEPSDIHDPGLVDFPPSRPATTELAKATGEALGRQGQARRQPARPAGGRQVLLLAAREHARDPAPRLLVGRAHAQHAAPARREHDPVLARPLRDQRGQGPRLPQDAAPERDPAPPRHRQLPRPPGRGRAGPGDALLPRCRGQREGRAQRELRPRDHGAVHHGRGPLRRDRHPRGGARVHRLERRRSDLRRPRRAARRRAQDRARRERPARRRSTSSTSSSPSRPPPSSSPARSTASWCARTRRPRFRRSSARCCARPTTS